LPTHVVQADKDQEVLQVVQREVDRLKLGSAVITLIGAVSEAEVSVMAKDNESVDYLRRYSQPMELSGTGEVIEGKVHLHVTLAGEDITAAGHLHRAVVGGFFVRAYLTTVTAPDATMAPPNPATYAGASPAVTFHAPTSR
jgi:predicted DNA-binding protein with PD1-like motif